MAAFSGATVAGAAGLSDTTAFSGAGWALSCAKPVDTNASPTSSRDYMCGKPFHAVVPPCLFVDVDSLSHNGPICIQWSTGYGGVIRRRGTVDSSRKVPSPSAIIRQEGCARGGGSTRQRGLARRFPVGLTRPTGCPVKPQKRPSGLGIRDVRIHGDEGALSG